MGLGWWHSPLQLPAACPQGCSLRGASAVPALHQELVSRSAKSRRLVLSFQKAGMGQYMWEEQLGAGEVGDPFTRCLQHGGSGLLVGLGQGRMLHIHQCLQFNLAQRTQRIKGTAKGTWSQTSTP